MPQDDAVLNILISGRRPKDIEDCQKRIKVSYGLRCSLSRLIPSNKKPGQYIAYADIFEPDGSYVEAQRY
jgi:hypothetical protein